MNLSPNAACDRNQTTEDTKTIVAVLTIVSAALLPCAAAQESSTAPNVSSVAPVGFEEAKPGPFEKHESEIGTWTPEVGRTIVDNKHAKTGKHCLQLTGGEKTSVTLKIAADVDTSGLLSFWAERWTVRKPFSFRIDKQTGDGWQEIYNGDSTVRVGRAFLNHVKVPLGDTSIQQLRFTVTSPPNTGVLIDDIRIAPARPQKIASVEVVPFTLPALVGAKASPLVKLKITTKGILNPISLTGVTATLDSTADKSPIESVYVAHTYDGLPGPSAEALDATDWEAHRTKTLKSSVKLAEGENIVWLVCKLKKDADIDERIGAAISQVTFSNSSVDFEVVAPSMQRLGVAVRQGGDDGVHTYRIPGLATTNKGTLIGVYDVRRRGGGDLPGDIDVGMSRSTDGGRTWEPKVIMDMGDDPDWRYDGIGDPAVLVDKNTGTIWVAATWSHGNRSWRGSGPGLKPEETGQLMLVRSDDDGVTWSKPINITEQVKKPEWCFILQGPGKGITMHDGTIVFAAQYQDPPDKRRLPHSTIIYSKDHGKTWQVGTGAFDDTTESQVVEMEPGVLMLNCRYNRKSVRVVMTTRDMGETWQKHTTSERALIEPGACMASLIDVDRELARSRSRETSELNSHEASYKGWLLFSNPDSTRGRNHITIKASPDRGLTWPKQHRLLLDEERSAGYSCMTMIDEKTVGILYEGSQAHMTFQRIPLSDIVGKQPVRRTSQSVDPTSDKSTDKDARRTTLHLPRVFTTESTETVFARRTAASDRPNILFIVSEDNSEHLGCYGEQRVHTPHLDALSAGGVRYTRAYVPYSVCSPSRAAFLTGLYTRQTGHIGLATHRFSMYRDFKTMPAYFQQAGYYTGFLGKTHVNPERLVEDYVDHRAIKDSNFGKTTSIETYAQEARAVMQKAADADKPFLLIINYADAHRRFVGKSKNGFPTTMVDEPIKPFPWIGSDTPHLREELRDYFNCMNRFDEGVGMVLDKLDETGARDNTLVIYISDHGADFPRGKGSIYENGTRIPMIVNYSKSFPKGKVENKMVSTTDILPTMLRAARLPVPDDLPGFALQDIDSGKVPPRKYIHTFTTGSAPNLLYMQFGIRDQRYKLVYNPDRALNRLGKSRYRNSQLPEDQHVQSFLYPPEYELFDLQEDPHEWKNLADGEQHQPIRQRLLKAMHDFQREIKDPFASKENIATFIAEQKEYQSKPYKKPGFRWPHLDMFKKAQETHDTDLSRQTIYGNEITREDLRLNN